LKELSRAARGAEVGLVFFAGHGIEAKGRNYLVPTDASLAKAADIELEAIALDAVLHQLEGASKLRLVILDACRTSPFPAGERSWRGLKAVAPDLGTLIAYAAKEGTLAADGHGRHSPFTAALLKRMVAPGVDVRRVFGYVRTDVSAATGGKQEPGIYSELGGDEIFLLPKEKGPASGAAAQKGSDPVGLTPGQALLAHPADVAWAAVKDSGDIASLELFRQHHGKERPVLDRAAALQIEALQHQKLALLEAQKERERLEALAKLDPALAVKPGSGQSFRDKTADGRPCPECPEMVVVPSGSFTMGSPAGEESHETDESPQRVVTIARPFAVGKFEVARGEFAAFVRETGWSVGDKCWTYEGGKWDARSGRSFRNPGFQQDDRHPVVCVNWEDATAYVGWLSKKTSKTYRLLTEAEWEYVTRAGTTTPFWWGKSISPSQANYNGNYTYGGGPKGEYRGKTLPVDGFAPNPWGLFNVHGNVWEWVQDCYHDSYNGAPTDGSAWTTADCNRRVLRGGSWYYVPRILRAAIRDRSTTDGRSCDRGFRLGRMLNS
jgi:formylglycine-generating enzyme required for sulfatase activity